MYEYIMIYLSYIISCTEFCNYLLMYEYVITDDLSKDTWKGMKRAVEVKGIKKNDDNSQSSRVTTPKHGVNRTLLLGGRDDGHICVFDWETGEVDFEIEVCSFTMYFSKT